MVMVHGIVAHGHGAGVQVEPIGFLGRFHCHGVASSDAPRFPPVGEEGETVFRGIYVVGYSPMAVSQFLLQEVYIAQRTLFGQLYHRIPRCGRHVQVLGKIVVGAYRPVEHDMPVREPAIGQHHFRAPELLAQGILAVHVGGQRVVAAVEVQAAVIARRFLQGHGAVIFFDDGDVGEVLGRYPVPECLAAGHFRHCPQFRSVHEHLRLYPRAVREGDRPAKVFFVEAGEPGAAAQLHAGFRSHIPQDFRSGARIEKDVGHPAGSQRLISAERAASESVNSPNRPPRSR